jgi:hypothetical protein
MYYELLTSFTLVNDMLDSIPFCLCHGVISEFPGH